MTDNNYTSKNALLKLVITTESTLKFNLRWLVFEKFLGLSDLLSLACSANQLLFYSYHCLAPPTTRCLLRLCKHQNTLIRQSTFTIRKAKKVLTLSAVLHGDHFHSLFVSFVYSICGPLQVV